MCRLRLLPMFDARALPMLSQCSTTALSSWMLFLYIFLIFKTRKRLKGLGSSSEVILLYGAGEVVQQLGAPVLGDS